MIDLVKLKSDFGLKYQAKTKVKISKGQDCCNAVVKATPTNFYDVKEAQYASLYFKSFWSRAK